MGQYGISRHRRLAANWEVKGNPTMQLLTKQGRLTRYAMACGYIEKTETPRYFITLLMDGSAIMVRTYNRETGDRGQVNCRTAREGYKAYNTLRRELAR